MSDEQRRRTPRYTFIASAELLEPQTEVRIATRVSELSVHGCYMDMLNPFPVGTPVRVKISADAAEFQSKARIVYAHPNLGVGVGFLDPEPQYLKVLQGWISEAEKDPGRLIK
ncbi:MAG: PilZ domain-containing protein [Acidobacteriota bacterium]|nr:PilZ domain-containing protein [Acidobacteriota bacterium]